jgi:cytochrome c peroxidase
MRIFVLTLIFLLSGCGDESRSVISQRDKAFHPGQVELAVGEPLVLLNDDERTHNIRVNDPAFKFDSGVQKPGEEVVLQFPDAGRYYVVCGIHPTMKLMVDVEGQ